MRTAFERGGTATPRRGIPVTRGWGIGLALATASVSGVSVFLNSYGVKAAGDAGVYTTAKNLVAAMVLLAVAAAARGSRERAPST